jgi:hypothetical protein
MNKKQNAENLEPLFIRLPKALKDQVQDLARTRGVSNALLVASLLDQVINGTPSETKESLSTWIDRHH